MGIDEPCDRTEVCTSPANAAPTQDVNAVECRMV